MARMSIMGVTLANGTVAQDRRLDRLPEFDERSRNYGIRKLLPDLPLRGYTWSVPVVLDQGNEGACVGFSISHEAAGRPVSVKDVTNESAQRLYKHAQQLDAWPGENYDGTSVLAGMKAAMERGWYSEYRWGFSLNDAVLSLGYRGPVILGINWYSGMIRPEPNGLIRVTGQVEGGHAIVATGVSVKNRLVRLHNSWGEDWGIQGECFISFEDLERLLYEDGEACIPTKRSLGPQSPIGESNVMNPI